MLSLLRLVKRCLIPEGAILNDRIPLTIKSYIENKNDANVWAGRARYGAGFISYRHIAYVSLKNIGLVTTSVGTFTLNGQTISDIATIANRGGVALKGYSPCHRSGRRCYRT